MYSTNIKYQIFSKDLEKGKHGNFKLKNATIQ